MNTDQKCPLMLILFALMFCGCLGAETRYLVFQVWPRMPGYPGIPTVSGRSTLSKSQMADFVREIVKAVGSTGDAESKLGFAIGPLCFDMPDDEIRQFLRDAFAVARENDVAVALHIDDSMSWGRRTDLLSDADNIETADWRQIPSKARRLDWGSEPLKFPPPMSYNAPAIVEAAKARAGLIGAEIRRELAVLKTVRKEYLFAGVIAGWETQMGRDFESGRVLGFRAMAHRGFSREHPPKDLDAERVSIVKEWMELWANELFRAGTPREKIFCHIAFTGQGLRKADAGESYAVKVGFAIPDVAFSTAYRPGFSTYPEGGTLREAAAVMGQHGAKGWISAEGTNVSPTGMPGEPTMESYLAKLFGRGAVLVNVFSWGIGGEGMRDNFFRRATEGPEALSAYAKFLRHEALVESTSGFSSESFQAKMRRIQSELPDWVRQSGQQARVQPLTEKLTSLIRDKKFVEADGVADQILAVMAKGRR
jgi:hypothetical protein